MKNSKTKPLRVATLNFSGINVSPFEYHDGSPQKELINKCFQKLLEDYQKENPNSKWNIAKIDKILQRERYSILYKSSAGVVRGRLLDKSEFEAVWDAVFEQNQHLVNHLTPSEESINLLRSFDWMVYEAFVTTLYGKMNWGNMKGYNVQRYVEDLRKWHQKNYLKWQPKITYVKNYIIRQNLDILFLQEAGHEKLESSIPEDYVCFRAGEAMIIVKKYFVVEDPEVSKFHLKYASKLNFNHDSHYVKLKHYLLCCAHLSSKSLNIKQAEQMQTLFKQIRQDYEGLNIIAGVDANHFLEDFSYLNVYPSAASHVTTRKKRSSMQLQFEKSQKLIEQAKDHIITNLTFEEIKVETINCQETSSEFLPNENHPYDHFVVFGTLKTKEKNQEIMEDELHEHENIFETERRRSFATTEVPNDFILDHKHIVTSTQSQKHSNLNHLSIDGKKKTGSLTDHFAKEGVMNNLQLLETSSHQQHKRQMNPSIFSQSKQKFKEQNLSKNEFASRNQPTRPYDGESKQYYVEQTASKTDQLFLQFTKPPKVIAPTVKNHRRTHLIGDNSKSPPKRGKSKQLSSAAYKKF